MSIGAYLAAVLNANIFAGTAMPTIGLGIGPSVRLWIGDPGPYLSSGAEVAGPYATTGYTGQVAVFADWSGTNPISNVNAIEWDEAKTAWGTITHVVISATPSDTDCLFYGALITPVTIDVGAIPRFAVGALAVLLS